MGQKTRTKSNVGVSDTAVCVLTARGSAAIASIGLLGSGGKMILERLLGKAAPACGQSVSATIRDRAEIVDSVVAACERPGQYMIHCHGNPLLTDRIVHLCREYGAVLQRPEDYLRNQLTHTSKTRIEAEARLEMTRAATLEGTRLLNGQIKGGLSAWAIRWTDCNSFDIKQLQNECREILRQSDIAGRILCGVKIALVGPPNSGKSTLLNWLAADKAALVSDTAGTTRDWVSTVCRIGPLRVEIIDTAGRVGTSSDMGEIDRAAQNAALEVIKSCDMLLNVRDCTRPETADLRIDEQIPILTVYTKSDLLADTEKFCPDCNIPQVLVSAHNHSGLNDLCSNLLALLQVERMSYDQPIAFTARQRNLVAELEKCSNESVLPNLLAQLVQ